MLVRCVQLHWLFKVLYMDCTILENCKINQCNVSELGVWCLLGAF